MPVMLEPMAPHNRDSTAPSAVMVKVGAIKSPIFAQGIFGRLSRDSRIRDWGISPIIQVDQLKAQLRSVARIIPRSEAGKRAFHFDGQNSIAPTTTSPRMRDWRSGV